MKQKLYGIIGLVALLACILNEKIPTYVCCLITAGLGWWIGGIINRLRREYGKRNSKRHSL